MSDSRAQVWAREIRDYLLGRLSTNAATAALNASYVAELTYAPVRRWWVFEGKRYAPLCGCLAENWGLVVRSALRLHDTFNPRLRLSDRPDGVVDWGNTLARGPHPIRPEYLLCSSGVGLNEEERAALTGWARWIADEWLRYYAGSAMPSDIDWCGLGRDVQGPFPVERLRRWAHTARRSRWPLMRGIVAESLRPSLESDELDSLPLPSDEAKLFELLCLVRIARCLAPPSDALRWLDAGLGSNTIALSGILVHYQQALEPAAVLSTYADAGQLASAVELFQVRVPRFIDLAFDFAIRREGLDGIIVEAKSGGQQYEHTIAQLRTYRAARPRLPGARLLIWGIVEKPDRPDATYEKLRSMFANAETDSDVWVFSSADSIPTVLEAARLLTAHGGGVPGRRAGV